MKTVTRNEIEEIKDAQAKLNKLVEDILSKPVTEFALPETAIDLKYGEHYAGIVIGKEGAKSYHLILVGEEINNANWQPALDWAKSIGADLPSRREQALLYANLKEQFTKKHYWSGETYDVDSGFAWIKNFDNGCQYYINKDDCCRVRTVRRLVIEERDDNTHTKEELIALAKEAGMRIGYACIYHDNQPCPCSSSKDEFCVGNEPYDIRSASFESLEKFATLLTSSNAEAVEPFAWAAPIISGGYDIKTNLNDIESNYTGKPFPLYTTPPSSNAGGVEPFGLYWFSHQHNDHVAEGCELFTSPQTMKSGMDERAEFEDYMRKEHPDANESILLKRNDDQVYWQAATHNRWIGWQARAKLSQDQSDKLGELQQEVYDLKMEASFYKISEEWVDGYAQQFNNDNLINWCVTQWTNQVQLRPLFNIHRRALDDTWRLIIKHLGANPDELIGESHSELLRKNPLPIEPDQTAIIDKLQNQVTNLINSEAACCRDYKVLKDKPIEMVIICPECHEQHIDEEEWATKLHKTHQCQICFHEWRPANSYTVGVQAIATKEGEQL